MEVVFDVFLETMMLVGFALGIALFFWSPFLLWRWLTAKRRRSPTADPVLTDMRTDETVPDATLLGNDRARVNAREAFDRTTGVFPPFDPRSHQFLYWMRQEWERQSAGQRSSGNAAVRHAFYLECARIRLAEIVAEGGLTRADADARLAGMQKALEESEHATTSPLPM